MSKYDSIYRDLITINDNIKDRKFLKHIFIYGSVSRLLVHEDSDIDLLLIGDKEKGIDLINEISKFFDDLQLNNEVDFKYFNINVFRSIHKNNLFLKKIQRDCKTIDEILMEIKAIIIGGEKV